MSHEYDGGIPGSRYFDLMNLAHGIRCHLHRSEM